MIRRGVIFIEACGWFMSVWPFFVISDYSQFTVCNHLTFYLNSAKTFCGGTKGESNKRFCLWGLTSMTLQVFNTIYLAIKSTHQKQVNGRLDVSTTKRSHWFAGAANSPLSANNPRHFPFENCPGKSVCGCDKIILITSV